MRLGYPAVQLRSDGEPAIRAFAEELGKELKSKGVRVIPNKTPKGDSQPAGLVEDAGCSLKAKCRTLVNYARELHGVVMGQSHPCLPWAVQYAGQLLVRSHRTGTTSAADSDQD